MQYSVTFILSTICVLYTFYTIIWNRINLGLQKNDQIKIYNNSL